MSASRVLARGWLARGAVAAVLAVAVALPAAAETTITIWSHEADEPAKVAWREKAARNFEAKNPDVKVKITWYDKPALNAALKTALRAGQGPDIFYAEPDQTEYITNGFATAARRPGQLGQHLRLGAGGVDPRTARRTGCRRRPTPSSSTTTRS